jgi:predicted nuclease with TOPRIM domain
MAYKSKKNSDLQGSNDDLYTENTELKEKIDKLVDDLIEMTNEKNKYKEQIDNVYDLKICGNCLTYKYSELLQQYVCGNNLKCRLFKEYCNSWQEDLI